LTFPRYQSKFRQAIGIDETRVQGLTEENSASIIKSASAADHVAWGRGLKISATSDILGHDYKKFGATRNYDWPDVIKKAGRRREGFGR
jgi:hypothetical protein